MKTVLKIVVGIILIIVVIVGARIIYLSKATKGEEITSSTRKSALLVLDVQEDTVEIEEYKETNKWLKNINQSIAYANNTGIPVIHTRQAFSNPLDCLLAGGRYIKGTPGYEVTSLLKEKPTLVYDKVRSDSFSNADLEKYLVENKITDLYLVGADASSCVYNTALGAKNRNYRVIVLEDALFSINDKYLEKAKKNYEENNIEIQDTSYFKNQENELTLSSN